MRVTEAGIGMPAQYSRFFPPCSSSLVLDLEGPRQPGERRRMKGAEEGERGGSSQRNQVDGG